MTLPPQEPPTLPAVDDSFCEQRKFPRISAETIGQLVCTIPLHADKNVTLQLTDISGGGFGATLPAHLGRHFSRGSTFSCCQINLAGLENVAIRVAGIWQLRNQAEGACLRAGFEFTSAIPWQELGLGS